MQHWSFQTDWSVKQEETHILILGGERTLLRFKPGGWIEYSIIGESKASDLSLALDWIQETMDRVRSVNDPD